MSAPPPSPIDNPKLKPSLPIDSSQVPATEITSSDFEEESIPSQLAAELIQPSFNPVQYKALQALPNSGTTRNECLLHEYDRRLDLHITYNALEFMIFKISENTPDLESIIDEQAMFEQSWPSPRKFHTGVTTSQRDTAVMSTLLQEAQLLIEQIQQTINTLRS